MDAMNTNILPATADEHSLAVDPAALPPIIAGTNVSELFK